MSNSINSNFIKNDNGDFVKTNPERGHTVRKNTLPQAISCIFRLILFILGLSLVICGSCGLISFLPSVICGSLLIAYTLIVVMVSSCFIYKENFKKNFKKSSLSQGSDPIGFYEDKSLQRAVSTTPLIVDPTISEVVPMKLPTDKEFAIPQFSNEIRLDLGKEMTPDQIKNIHNLHVAVRVLLGNDRRSMHNREMMHWSTLDDLKIFCVPGFFRTSNLVYESEFFPGIIFKSKPLSQIRRYERAHKLCKKVLLDNKLDLICLPKMYIEGSSVLKYDEAKEPWGLIIEEKLDFSRYNRLDCLHDSSEKTALYLQWIKFVQLTLFKSEKHLYTFSNRNEDVRKIALLEPDCIQILSGDCVDQENELRKNARSFLSVAKSLGENRMFAEREKIIAACLELCSTPETEAKRSSINAVDENRPTGEEKTPHLSANSNISGTNSIQIPEQIAFKFRNK